MTIMKIGLGWLAKLATIVGGVVAVVGMGPGQPSVIGERVTVAAGPGASGTIIGESITVTAGPETHGTVIGKQVTVGIPLPQAPDAGDQQVILRTEDR
jgi:carbonic anhydrase/acetyltransferase-like protein (isoleucine patch superfamily)